METTPTPSAETTPPVETAPPIKSLPPSAPPPADSGAEDKTVAILSYCTLLGFIVAIILHQQKKTKLGAYHLRQALGFVIAVFVGWIAVFVVCLVVGVVLAFIINILAVIVVWLIYVSFILSILGLWIMGFISAIQGQMKPMPVVGPYFQKWFANTFE